MKVLKEAKENLPIDFITSFVSSGWEEVGNIKASIDGIKHTFKNTKDVEEILQDLVDAYLICIGRLEGQLNKKNYIDLPTDEQLNEDLDPSTTAEIKAELPNYDIEIEQQDNNVEIELKRKTDATNIQDESDNTFVQDEVNNIVPENNNPEAFEYFVDFAEPEIDSNEQSPYQQWMHK